MLQGSGGVQLRGSANGSNATQLSRDYAEV